MARRATDRIVSELHEQITSGSFEPGARLPTTAELTKRYAVSRQTVQNAMAELIQGGEVIGISGSGWYVAELGDREQLVRTDPGRPRRGGWVTETVVGRKARSTDHRPTGVAIGTAVQVITRTTYDEDGSVAAVTTTILPADGVELIYELPGDL